MKVIKLGKETAPDIAEFFNKNFSDGWTEKMLLSAFDTGRFNALAVKCEEEVVGVITFSLSLDGADIEDVVVLREKRKRGIGGLLVLEALSQIEKSGAKKVFLEVRETNCPAIDLYKKFGFSPLSVRKRYYSDGENALVMIKEF